MKTYVYSVFDRKAQYYLPLFAVPSEADGIRAFTDMVVQSDTNLSKYPADFDLVELAQFHVLAGDLVPTRPVNIVINGLVALEASRVERARYLAIFNKSSETADAS